MITVPLAIDGLTAWCNPLDGCFRISGLGQDVALRPWSWGERRRLIDPLVTRADAGRAGEGTPIDATALVDGLLELLCRPAIPEPFRPIFAHAALLLLGVRPAPTPPGGPPPTFVEAELLLADSFGWTPRAIDGEPAARIDALVAELRRRRARSAPMPVAPGGDGWNHILVSDDEP